jgi:ABC-type lipoprotein release transport system permease subunit
MGKLIIGVLIGLIVGGGITFFAFVGVPLGPFGAWLLERTTGELPGILITASAYFVMEKITGLPMYLNFGRVAGLLFATVVMCIGSGLLALRKAKTVDPANVF